MLTCVIFNKTNGLSKVLLLILWCWSCSSKDIKPVPNIAFYHWQTHLSLSQETVTYLSSLETKQLYIKFFDIDWSVSKSTAIPLATVHIDTSSIHSFKIIPCVFITNRTLQELPKEHIAQLAAKIRDKIAQIARKKGLFYDEIQIDCDWSQTTKDKYFELVKEIKKLGAIKLAVTIRLHQLKYPRQTGVPPADKGVLMCYNVGKVDDIKTQNSIIDKDIITEYLNGFSTYPFALDIALPLFNWGCVFRYNELVSLLNGLQASDLSNSTYFEQIEEYRYLVKQSTYVKGVFLYRGDIIRLEESTFERLQKTKQLLQQYPFFEASEVIFYHLDSTLIRKFSAEQLEMLKMES